MHEEEKTPGEDSKTQGEETTEILMAFESFIVILKALLHFFAWILETAQYLYNSYVFLISWNELGF